MSSMPFNREPDSFSSTQGRGSRRLNDEVFQSAEDAVVKELDDHAGLIRPGINSSAAEPYYPPRLETYGSYGTHATYDASHTGDEEAAAERAAGGAINRLVAARPGQASLVAAAVGALGMVILRAQLRKLTWRRGPAQRR